MRNKNTIRSTLQGAYANIHPIYRHIQFSNISWGTQSVPEIANQYEGTNEQLDTPGW